MGLRLRLFGGISWETTGTRVPLRGRTRIDILLALAEAEGAVVSVATLLDRFWQEVPSSGANAVQRHVSALRRQLAEAGVDDPSSVIEAMPLGYRLHGISTDLTDPGDAEWWLEPAAEASSEHHRRLKRRLGRLAIRQVQAELAKPTDNVGDSLLDNRLDQLWEHTTHPVELIDAVLVAAERGRPSAWLTNVAAQSSAAVTADQHARISELVGRDSPAHEPPSLADLEAERETVRQVVGLWVDGRSDHALDLLDETTSVLDADLRRRLYRAVVWQRPDDGGARGILQQLAELRITLPQLAERSLVSADSNSLNLMPDGDIVGGREVREAVGPGSRTRALRVEFLRLLAQPLDDASVRIIDDLRDIDTADAAVEAERFAFVNALRTGEWEDASRQLETYRRVAGARWPVAGDDFAEMVTAGLQRSLDPLCASTFAADGRRYGRFNGDPYLLVVADAARFLTLWPAADTTLHDVAYHAAITVLRSPAARALSMLNDQRAGRPVIDAAHALAEELDSIPRDRQFLLVPIALGRIAEQNRDRALAKQASETLRPWSGQAIGLWPVDLIFGMADQWIDRFAST